MVKPNLFVDFENRLINISGKPKSWLAMCIIRVIGDSPKRLGNKDKISF